MIVFLIKLRNLSAYFNLLGYRGRIAAIEETL
jgi:hypothetical protein